MGKDKKGNFVPGLITTDLDYEINEIRRDRAGFEAVEPNEKAQIGLMFLTELTGAEFPSMANENAIDLEQLNKAFSQIYVGRRSMNWEGNLLTRDNWKSQLRTFAEMMSAYLESPIRELDVPGISVQSGADFYGVKVYKKNSLEQKAWQTFNETADSFAAACIPTVREQVYHLGWSFGTLEESKERYRMLNDLNCMYDEHGQFNHQKVDEYLDACADWMVENILKKGQEVQKLLPEFQDVERVDAFGLSALYAQENGDELSEAELMAIESYRDAGLYTMQENTLRSNLLLELNHDMTPNRGWMEYLVSKGYPVTDPMDEICLNTNPMRLVEERMLERLEARKKKVSPEEQYQLMLGFHCTQEGTVKIPFDENQKAQMESCKERLTQETNEALEVIRKREEGRLSLTDPKREQNFVRHMNNLVRLGEQFKLADHWYHGNGEAYDKLVEGMDTLRDMWLLKEAELGQERAEGKDAYLAYEDLNKFNKKIREVEALAETYLSDKGKARGTGLGKDRYAIAMNMLYELDPKKYREQELQHNTYRESHNDARRVTLQDLQKRVEGHAQSNKKNLNQNVKGIRTAAEEQIKERKKAGLL